MFFPFLLAGAIGIGFIQLGALSVWVTVLSLAIKLMLLIILAPALYLGVPVLWKRYKGTPE